MNATTSATSASTPHAPSITPTKAHIEAACAHISPTWPLDSFIAVNPFWELTQQSVREVSAAVAANRGARMLMPRAWYRERWLDGRLRSEHVERAIFEAHSEISLDELVAHIFLEAPDRPVCARVLDVADERRDLQRATSWRDFVIQSISQFCASYFDDGQAQLQPDRSDGLFRSWRRHAIADHAPRLSMGFDNYASLAREMPTTAHAMIEHALEALGVMDGEREHYLTGLLFDVNGWASWCAYERWSARLSGQSNDVITELLAIRIAWDWLVFSGNSTDLLLPWKRAMSAWATTREQARTEQASDWLWQRATEIAWQDFLCDGLQLAPAPKPSISKRAQVAFCIDVRSEVFRRALESAAGDVNTLGFAGFFGMPIDYLPLAADHARAQLPGLLAPKFRVTDEGSGTDTLDHHARNQNAIAWKAFKTGSFSSFSLIESVGVLAAGKLFRNSFVRSKAPFGRALSFEKTSSPKPRLTHHVDGKAITLDERVALADGILHAMSLTRDFARLLVLVGHGSETNNNAHRAGLDCGACCGQTGEVNARAAAALLNDPEVRSGLREKGTDLPTTTHVLAGLHNTTTDEITLFDLDEVPSSHEADVRRLNESFEQAGVAARDERARRFDKGASGAKDTWGMMTKRAKNWAELRPEWGLANNAAFVVARRSRTAHMNLEGRVFLHDYLCEQDSEFKILELIMTAPMLVTHWINFQYYASTVDNVHYGSGNKVLHNVVGGHLGVFEGNAGDLRIGLPMQSVHDGEKFVHTPLRLSVVLEAPREAISAVLQKHSKVSELVDNEWLYLFQLAENGQVAAYRNGAWHDMPLHGARRN